MTVRKTARQKEAVALMSDPAIRKVLLSGGSRSGKTFIICYAIVVRALKAANTRHAILRFRFRDVKNAIGRDTLLKVLKLLDVPYNLDKTDWFFTLPNGSEIWLGGLDDDERVEKILGLEYATLFFNESSQISYHAVTTALTRLAQKCDLINRAFFDCNPPTKLHWLYKYFIKQIDPVTNIPLPAPERYAVLNVNPEDNRENLPAGYIEDELGALTERKRRRFKDGEWLDAAEGALWKYPMIDAHRVQSAPLLYRIVVGVDPAVTGNRESAETGIVVAGIDSTGHYYVLDDCSIQGTPLDWARRVTWGFDKYRADRVIGETNNGGDLVEVNLRTVNRTIPFRKVTASRGKYIRAEPIAGLYEKGEVHHVGMFPELEDQMCEWVPGDKSPDRCLAAGTLITTSTGPIPIEEIRPGALVLTRRGYREVIESGMTSQSTPLVTITCSDGKSLTGTPNHQIYTKTRGFIGMDALVWDDILWTEKSSSTMDSPMRGIPTQKANPERDTFTRSAQRTRTESGERPSINRFGLMQTARFQKGATSTTLTETHQTIPSTISDASHIDDTRAPTSRANAPMNTASISTGCVISQKSGMPPTRGSNGTGNTGKTPGRAESQNTIRCARSVENHLNRSLSEHNSAPGRASTGIMRRPADITKNVTASFVEDLSKSKNPKNSKPAPARVVQKCAAGTGPVFNLSVKAAHEFYANGILVHNCDALVWAITALTEDGPRGNEASVDEAVGAPVAFPGCGYDGGGIPGL